MSSTENSSELDREGDPPGQRLTYEQATALQQLLRFQSDIARQGQRVALAVNKIAGVLDNGGNVSPEVVNHVKAQLLKVHLQLDDLEEVLDSIV